MTASELGANPLAGWQYEYVPREWVNGAVCKLLQRATTVNVRQTVYSGAQTIVERSPVQGGGTAGTTPSELNTAADVWLASPGDRLKLANDEVGAAVATVDGMIVIEPA
jgi:hypothetical protein